MRHLLLSSSISGAFLSLAGTNLHRTLSSKFPCCLFSLPSQLITISSLWKRTPGSVNCSTRSIWCHLLSSSITDFTAYRRHSFSLRWFKWAKLIDIMFALSQMSFTILSLLVIKIKPRRKQSNQHRQSLNEQMTRNRFSHSLIIAYSRIRQYLTAQKNHQSFLGTSQRSRSWATTRNCSHACRWANHLLKFPSSTLSWRIWRLARTMVCLSQRAIFRCLSTRSWTTRW